MTSEADHPKAIIALCTCPSADEAKSLAHHLLENRLIACVNIMTNVRSLYRWDGQVCDDPEVLMVMKSTEDRATALTDAIISAHSYDVPEVLFFPALGGSADYLDWVRASVSEDSSIRTT